MKLYGITQSAGGYLCMNEVEVVGESESHYLIGKSRSVWAGSTDRMDKPTANLSPEEAIISLRRDSKSALEVHKQRVKDLKDTLKQLDDMEEELKTDEDLEREMTAREQQDTDNWPGEPSTFR